MSELSVGAVAVGAGVLLLPLLIVAGVGMGAAILASQAAKAHPVVSAASMGGELRRRSRQARSVLAGQLAGGVPRKRTTAVRELSREIRDLADAMAVRRAMAEMPALETIVAARDGAGLKRACQDLDGARKAWQGGHWGEARQLAAQARGSLATMATRGIGVLREAQQDLVASNVRQALASLGFTVEEASEREATAFRAIWGTQVLGVVVGRNGRLVVDAAGFAGQSCRLAREELYAALRRQGVFVELEVASQHDPYQGRALLRDAGGAKGAGSVLAAYRALQEARSSTGIEAQGRSRGDGARPAIRGQRDRLRRAMAAQLLQARRIWA